MNVNPILHLVGCLMFTLVANVALAQDVGQDAAQKIQPVGELEMVKDGFDFTEGPAWDPTAGALYFTDIPNTAIHRLDRNDQLSAFTTDSKHANGLMVAADGRLLACQMDGQVVAYNSKTGETKVLVSQHNGKRFNAPNDLVLDKSGGLYFTDPLFRAPTPLPQKVQAFYYLSAAGDVSRVTDVSAAPNGIGLSPDGKRLYVIPSRQAEMLVYDVVGPGKLSKGRTLCRLKQPQGKNDTGGDGMTLDIEGNLYITTNLGVEIISPAGEHRGLVVFPQQPANVTFGGEDRKTMYVTARTALYRIRMPIAGLAPN